MLAHWIWLAHRPGLTDWLKWQILQKFGDPDRVYNADSYEEIEGLTDTGLEALMDKSLSTAEKILETCVNKHLHILTIADAGYPNRLKNIPDPPLVLYFRGQLPPVDDTAVIGVVGTRHASPYGLTVARRMGYQISRCGGIVVSGMALGIDAMSMNGGLLGDAPVIGVLGCGADQIYPRKNRSLFEDTARYGCILSEFPPETPPVPWNFPRRNRIISGLSCGVLVVEAPLKSGALITAHQALDQGRDVFVVPGNIGVSSCEGSNRLLREGAIAVGCGWDVLSEYEQLYPGKLRDCTLEPEPDKEEKHRVAQTAVTPEKEDKDGRKKQPEAPENTGENRKTGKESEKKVIDNPAPPPYIDINDILQQCNPQEKAIVQILEKGETLVDNIIAGTGLRTQEVLSSLTMLEIRGIIQRHPGRRISLREN